jgi:SAM-dependent methyltransferase
MADLEALRKIVAGLDSEQVYRTIYDENLRVLVPGKEQIDAETLRVFREIDFTGKSVVDVGCNFGFFTFEAKRLGAAEALGVDRDAPVLEGCRVLRRYFGAEGVEFAAFDIEEKSCALLQRKFDLAMLVEFIGKGIVNAGKVAPALAFLECLSDKELILSVQKIYWINKDLQTTPEALSQFYPERYLKNGDFLLLEYVRDFYAPKWSMQLLSEDGPSYEKPRKFLRFTRT